MARFLVTKKRSARADAPSALDAVRSTPTVIVVDSTNADMVTIETTDEGAAMLQQRLGQTHWVEPVVRRGLH